MRNQKGITLVALVITIIVLLILAGVSISLVVGQNGVLGQASNAVVTQKAASVKEKVTSALAAAEIAYQAAWAQSISSGSNTDASRATIYANTVQADLEKTYPGDVWVGTLVTEGGSGKTDNIVIKTGTDVFIFTVNIKESDGTTVIAPAIRHTEKASSMDNTNGAVTGGSVVDNVTLN